MSQNQNGISSHFSSPRLKPNVFLLNCNPEHFIAQCILPISWLAARLIFDDISMVSQLSSSTFRRVNFFATFLVDGGVVGPVVERDGVVDAL